MTTIQNQSQLLSSFIAFKSENHIYSTPSKLFTRVRQPKFNSSFQNISQSELNEYPTNRKGIFTSKERFVTKGSYLSNNGVLDIGLRVFSHDGNRVKKTKTFKNGKFSPLSNLIQGKRIFLPHKSKQIMSISVTNNRSNSLINKGSLNLYPELSNDMIYFENIENNSLLTEYNHNRSLSDVNNSKLIVQDESPWDNHNFINQKINDKENLWKIRNPPSNDKKREKMQNDLHKNEKDNENFICAKNFMNIEFDSHMLKQKISSVQNKNSTPLKVRPSIAFGVKKLLSKPVKSLGSNFDFNSFTKLDPMEFNLYQNQISLIKFLQDNPEQTTQTDQIGSDILNQKDLDAEELNDTLANQDDNSLLTPCFKFGSLNNKFEGNTNKQLSYLFRNENKNLFSKRRKSIDLKIKGKSAEEIEKKSIDNPHIKSTLLRAQTSTTPPEKRDYKKIQTIRAKTAKTSKKSESPITSIINKLTGFPQFTNFEIEKDGLTNKSDDSTLREYMGKQKQLNYEYH